MIIHINSAEVISLIDNAAYISNTTQIITTYQNACSECICNAFFSNILSPYVGLNCYKNNKTCQLFNVNNNRNKHKFNIHVHTTTTTTTTTQCNNR